MSHDALQNASFFIESPVAIDTFAFVRVRTGITIKEVNYLCVGGTNWVGQVQEGDANGLNGANTQSIDTTALAGVNNSITTFSNAVVDAGDYLVLKTTSVSGTPTSLVVTINYLEN